VAEFDDTHRQHRHSHFSKIFTCAVHLNSLNTAHVPFVGPSIEQSSCVPGMRAQPPSPAPTFVAKAFRSELALSESNDDPVVPAEKSLPKIRKILLAPG